MIERTNPLLAGPMRTHLHQLASSRLVSSTDNLFSLAQLSCSSRLLQALLNTTLAVDTFFMISGLVTVISFVRKCKSALTLIRPASSSLIKTNQDGRDDYAAGLSSACPAHQRPPNLIKPKHDSSGSNNNNNNNKDSSIKGPTTATISANGTDSEAFSVDDSSDSSVITSLSSSVSSSKCIGLPKDSLATSNNNNNNSSGKRRRAKRITARNCDGRLSPEVAPNYNAIDDSGGSWWPSDFNPLLWLLMRYLRLTPAYASIIGLSILMPALGSGPYWAETVGQLGPACRANWWLNMLYLNNFLETDKLCLIHSWYLSNDWQFFLLALVLFATFYKSKKSANNGQNVPTTPLSPNLISPIILSSFFIKFLNSLKPLKNFAVTLIVIFKFNLSFQKEVMK